MFLGRNRELPEGRDERKLRHNAGQIIVEYWNHRYRDAWRICEACL